MANHNTGPGLQDGGMTVYYFQPPNNAKTTAFGKVSGHPIWEMGVDLNVFIAGVPHDRWQSDEAQLPGNRK